MRLRLYSLDQQVEHHMRILSHLTSGNHFERVVLIGHSIGGYIALRLLNRIEHSSVLGLIVFGFLTTSHLGIKRGIYRILNLIFLRDAISFLVSLMLPLRSLRAYYFRRDYAHLTEKQAAFFASQSGFRFLRQIIYMAASEMKTLPRRFREIALPHYAKVRFYFTDKDRWVPKKLPDHLRERGFSVIETGREIPHDFIMYPAYSESMARLVAYEIMKTAESPGRQESG